MKFAEISEAEKLVSNLYPGSKVRFIEYGYDNLIGIVNDEVVLRFPRREDAYQADLYEEKILDSVKIDKKVAIPKVLKLIDNPYCFVTTLVKGESITRAQFNALSEKEQTLIGEDIAEFAYEFHKGLPITQVKEIKQEFNYNEANKENEVKWLKPLLIDKTFPTSAQDKIAKDCYAKWDSLNLPYDVSVHNDLHFDNLLFLNNRLSGVLDFACTDIGAPEQDFRQLYRINETTLKAAINKYEQLSEKKLDIEAIKILSIVQELAAYSRAYFNNDTNHHSFHRACTNLNRWFNTDIWK